MTGVLEHVDTQLDHLVRSWNLTTTILLVVLVGLLIYPFLSSSDPDTHPLLLTRQANISAIRQPGESAVYRSLEVPHGYPLRSGLNVKEPGQSKWAPGKDGDLRDIWIRAVNGAIDDEGKQTAQRGKLMTIFGKQNVIDHDLKTVTKSINSIGKYVKSKGATTVAIYLPNCIELIEVVFAAAFYGFHPVLVPYDQQHDIALQLIALSNADLLVAAAGSLPLADISAKCTKVQETVFVVPPSSRQMGWSDEGSKAYHELVEEGNASSDLPSKDAEAEVPDIVTIWQNDKPESGEMVAFTQKNIVAAIGAQVTALPVKHRMGPADLYLPADALTSTYILVQTLAALFSNASVVFNSVAGREVELQLATMGIAPTIVSASAESALKMHKKTLESVTGTMQKIALKTQVQALAAGSMPVKPTLTSPAVASIGTPPGKLRLLYVFERINAGTPPLSSHELSELRAFTGARVIYGLTSARVAGTIAQTSLFDYRIDDTPRGKHGHFGVPLGSVEIKLLDTDDHKTTDTSPRGEIAVFGPAVKDGTTNLGVSGTFRPDGTLAYI